MTMKTTIISSGASPPPAAGVAPCAKAWGIKPFMAALRLRRGRHYAIGARECREPAGCNGLAQGAHQLQVKMQVVDGVEPRAQDFVAAVEVAKVGAREILARIAAAFRVHWREIVLMHAVADVDDAGRGEQVPVARMTRGHDTVEHVYAARHGLNDV